MRVPAGERGGPAGGPVARSRPDRARPGGRDGLRQPVAPGPRRGAADGGRRERLREPRPVPPVHRGPRPLLGSGRRRVVRHGHAAVRPASRGGVRGPGPCPRRSDPHRTDKGDRPGGHAADPARPRVQQGMGLAPEPSPRRTHAVHVPRRRRVDEGLPGTEDGVAKELMHALAGLDTWRDARLMGLPEDSPWLPRFEDAASAQGFAVNETEDGVAPELELPGSYEQYLAALPAKLRHEIRRKDRRLDEATGGHRLIDASSETLVQDLGTFVAMHRASEGPKGRFMQPGMEIFFRRLGEAVLAAGGL